MKLCDYGCNQEAIYIFKNGKKCCSKSVNSCPANKRKNSDSHNGVFAGTPCWQTNHKYKSWNKGLTQETNQIVRRIAEKNKISLKGISKGVGSTIDIETERRRKISEAIKKRYEDGWMPKAGRCKKIKYKSHIAGDVLLDGTWEFKVAQYFDIKNINWIRNKKRFKYYNLDNRESHYTPDFYLIDDNKYIEVKGYVTNLDKCKWSQFPDDIEIWNLEKLIELKIL